MMDWFDWFNANYKDRSVEEPFCSECQAKFDANDGVLRVLDMCEECKTVALASILGVPK